MSAVERSGNEQVRFAALSLLLALGMDSGHAAQLEPIVAPTVPVAGLSQAEWSRAWWQWAASFNAGDSPVADRTGEKCHLKQSGEVWFLAGTYGTRRTVRKCTIPSGKYLFFPLINSVVHPSGEAQTSCLSVIQTARRATDNVAALVLDLDGMPVSNLEEHRQATTQCFDLGVKMEPPVAVYPTAANGYYVMLKPLKPGTYELNFGGILPTMMQAVTYTLIVE